MSDFHSICIAAAEAILGGSLSADPVEFPNAQHVHQSSWKFLARINELGMLTHISQDAMSMRSDEPAINERAYACGHMILEQARKFVRVFNVAQNSMLATLSVPEDIHRLIAERKYQGITNREYTSDQWILRGVMPLIDDSRLFAPQVLAQASDVESAVVSTDNLVGIHVIDLKWGRRATSKGGLWPAVIEALRRI